MASASPGKRRLVWALVLMLCLLHHDFWFWTDRSVVLGFIPVGLFFHMLISVASSLVWALAARHCWPARLEEWAAGAPRAGRGAG